MARIRLLSSAIVMDVLDSRNIQDRSLLKVYNKDPSHAFNHMAKAVNGDMRVSTAVTVVLVLTAFPAHTALPSHTPPPAHYHISSALVACLVC